MTNQPFDHPTASAQRGQSSSETAQSSAQAGHIEGVRTTSAGLVRAMLGSAAAAIIILLFFWLPAEYGVDATGFGRITGLTQMGEIKQQLYQEAASEDALLVAQAAAAQVSADPKLIARLDALEKQVAGIAAVLSAAPQHPAAPAAAPPPADKPAPTATSLAPAVPASPEWRDEVSYTLAPTEGVEIKLVMDQGARAEFAWTANGSILNYDTHGDGSGQRITYERGRGVPEQMGEIVAAFTGNHGWFWRNRTEAPVTLTLRTRGDYSRIAAP